MKRIYSALAVYSVLFFAGAGYLGWRLHETQAEPWKSYHLQAGVFAAIWICFVHSLIFIHLLGTGLGIKRAIDEHGLDEAKKRDLHRFKMRAFPPAMASMVATIATAVLGGAAIGGGSVHLHLAFVGIALVVNLLTFPIVIPQLAQNERLLRAIESEVAAKEQLARERASAPPQPLP
jgi:hypothetical protein